MIVYVLFGLLLFAAAVFMLRWFVSADPKSVVRLLRWALVILVVGLLALLLWGGTRIFSFILLALPFLLPLLLSSRGLRNRIKSARGPSPGQTSEVQTRFLNVTLDHDSGDMSGVVREGRYRGRRLEELDDAELLELWRDCRVEDPESASVLEAFLDRSAGPDWRQAAGAEAQSGQSGPRPGEQPPMTLDEALQILGLERGARVQEIHDAHRRLMQKVHPDHGGSNYLAAKINQAKEILLKNAR